MYTKLLMVAGLTLLLTFKAPASMFNDYYKTETLELSASNITSLMSKSGAGDVKILGQDDIDTISLIARFGGAEIDKNDYVLSLSAEGDAATLVSSVESQWFGNSYIDLELMVPAKLRIKAEDGSGDLRIENIDNDIRVEDGSGDVLLSNIKGDVFVEDKSGDLSLLNLGASLRVEDKSGDIEIRGVDGNVRIEDASGDIEIRNAGANVNIEDSSGDIDVNKAEGDVTIVDTSGDVEVSKALSFTITKTGGGDIQSSDIRNDKK